MANPDSEEEKSQEQSGTSAPSDDKAEDATVVKTEHHWHEDAKLAMKQESAIMCGISHDKKYNASGGAVGENVEKKSEGCSGCPTNDSRIGTEVKTLSAEKLHAQLDKVLFEHLHDIPGVFKRYGRNLDSTKLQIRIAKGKGKEAQAFLKEHLGSPENIEIIEDDRMNVFLKGSYFLANPHMRPDECTYQVGRGSAVVSVSPTQAKKLDYGKDIGQLRKTCGTLTCIMRDEATGKHYGFTPAHVLLDEATGDHEWPPIAYDKIVISDYKREDNWTITKLASSFFAGMEYVTMKDDMKKFVDIGIFEIDDSQIEKGCIRLALGNDYHGVNTMYEESMEDLMGKKVVKIGAETGRSFGKVTSVHETMVLKFHGGKEIILTGGIMVSPDNDEYTAEFARNGDSGAPVFLVDETNTIAAYICAGSYKTFTQPDGTTLKVYSDIYCIRMDTALHYTKMKTDMDLHFSQTRHPPGIAQTNYATGSDRVLTYERSSSPNTGDPKHPDKPIMGNTEGGASEESTTQGDASEELTAEDGALEETTNVTDNTKNYLQLCQLQNRECVKVEVEVDVSVAEGAESILSFPKMSVKDESASLQKAMTDGTLEALYFRTDKLTRSGGQNKHRRSPKRRSISTNF